MTAVAGSTTFAYEHQTAWARLPDGMRLHETPGVAVDAGGRVYALTRNTDNPILVFEADGAYVTTFGKGIFTGRSHGITVGPDGNLWATDDGTHTVTKLSPSGEVLLTIGVPGQAAPRWSNQPFCRPTQASVSRHTGRIYVSDGYANAAVHMFAPDGRLLKTWGSPGIDPGQFMVPHNIVVDAGDRVYVADREAHRVQVFDAEGELLTIWQNVHRPCGLTAGPDGNIYIGELNGVGLVQDCPGYGHRISIYRPDGTLLSRYGDSEEGEGAGHFIAPHGIAVDARGDVYVGEVSYTIRGSHMDPPRELRSLSKLRRLQG